MAGHQDRLVAKAGTLISAALLSVSMAAPAAQAATGSDPDLKTAEATAVSWKNEAGGTETIRALTPAEVTARGLAKYVNLSRYEITKPHKSAGAAPAVRTNSKEAAVAAAYGCWSHDTRSVGTDQLYGTGHTDWCGNGSAITYTSSSCSGYDAPWIPSYKYLSCTANPSYGVGFNVYDVRYNWDLCPLYVPLWDSCTTHSRPLTHLRFGAGGSYWVMSQS
ncbi:hypothetical protein [Streptomyces sp. NPDC001381]|uniref:hypothetical protein n=1 Tax=Streptomyces sp. NPDC001381 TaxID=3364567 RepID=UPI0036C8B11A